MKTSLDCIPCLIRQALEAARMVSEDPGVHERIIRELMQWTAELDLKDPPPLTAQRIHRRLREITRTEDPYRQSKDSMNRMAMDLLPQLRAEVESAQDPLAVAVRLAIAGNVIDMGVNGKVTEFDVKQAVQQALAEPLVGEWDGFRQACAEARRILYLADNAGEIAFDRLLIEQLSPDRVTVAVRGSPVLNDATLVDARAVGLDEIVEVIDNGSDAPGTILRDCHREFTRRFTEADLILAKGQGNFESLSDERNNIFFLLKTKCPVVATHVGHPLGSHVLARSRARPADHRKRSGVRI